MNPKSISFLAALFSLLAAASAHAQAQVFHGTISVAETGTELELETGSSSGVSLPEPPNPNLGDYFLNLPGDVGVEDGALITSIAQNEPDLNGSFRTSAAAFGFASGTFTSDQYFISVNLSLPDADSIEGNGDSAFAFFNYSDWFSGTLKNSVNAGNITDFCGSPSLAFGNDEEISQLPTGQFRADLRSVNRGSQSSILLVNGAKNEDNYALSQANDDGTFTIFCHDNGVNGAVFEQDPVNFVNINLAEVDERKGGLVAMGRVFVRCDNGGCWRFLHHQPSYRRGMVTKNPRPIDGLRHPACQPGGRRNL